MSQLQRLICTQRASDTLVARCVLSDFMRKRASQTAAAVGFSWIPTPHAPNNYDMLKLAYRDSTDTGQPLPVSDDSTGSIYMDAESDAAFRFVHDVHHVRFKLHFGLLDELDLALWQLSELATGGYGETTLPWQLLHAALIGNARIVTVSRRFEQPQRRLKNHCLIAPRDPGLLPAPHPLASSRHAD